MGNEKSLPVSPLSRAAALAVRVELARRGLRQSDLTRLAGRSDAHWSKRLNLKIGFSLDDIDGLAGAFGLSPDAFMAKVLAELPNV